MIAKAGYSFQLVSLESFETNAEGTMKCHQMPLRVLGNRGVCRRVE
jgi:hypothetical protein